MDTTALRLAGVTKTYPGVIALRDVSFEVAAGEVHALVGENGAGKSTLMGIAAGSTLPDTGSVEIGGVDATPASPALAEELGLAIVYQTPALVPDLTVAENLYLNMPAERRPPGRQRRAWAARQLEQFDVDLDPGLRVRALSVAQRQLVDITRAMAIDPKVLILDEPTEPLLAAEIERLFERIEAVARAGAAVVYISHRLREVRRIADRITVLRDGEVRGTVATADVSEDDIVGLIAGRSFASTFPPRRNGDAPDTGPGLTVTGFSGAGFHDVTLDVAAGEIVGLAGVEGNGQETFIRALAGLGPTTGGVHVDGRAVSMRNPRTCRDAGIVYLSADRHGEGLFLAGSIRDNITAGSLGDDSRFGFVSKRSQARRSDREVDALGIKTATIAAPVATLSGGNQQKVALARALLSKPRVLLVDEPTQGVDVGSRVEIYAILREVADAGAAVIVRSTDGLELEGMCDRVVVFSRGHIARELAGDGLTEHNIISEALTSTQETHRAQARVTTWRTLPRLRRSDFGPALVLLAAIGLFGAYVAGRDPLFLSATNLESVLALLSVLIFATLAQQAVMLTGGIDLSIGPAVSLLVVIASFFVTPEKVWGYQLFGVLLMLLAAVAIGAVNGGLVEGVRITPLIATLITFTVLQGLALLLRPSPEGEIDIVFTDVVATKVGFVPVTLIVAIVLAVGLDVMIRRTRYGMMLRAVGSDGEAARRLGVRVRAVRFSVYLVAGVLVFLAGVVLMGQVGVGTANAGLTYTLTSIIAVVLGGAAVAGGRGAFVGGVAGAVLIQEVSNATTFLQLTDAWQQWFLGGLILIGAAVYSSRRAR